MKFEEAVIDELNKLAARETEKAEKCVSPLAARVKGMKKTAAEEKPDPFAKYRKNAV